MRDINEGSDWDIFSIEGVEGALETAARQVSNHTEYGEYVTLEDLTQEAFIIAAGMGKRVREGFARKNGRTPGSVVHEVKMDLINLAHTAQQKAQRNTSYEERYSPAEGGGVALVPPSPSEGTEVPGYTRELIESLIPAIWDEGFAYGVQIETAADPDMPRGSTNKAHGSTLLSHIADIKTAWVKAPLRLEERRALILAFGLDWGQREIAANQGVSQKTVSVRITTGIHKLMAALGGDQ